MAHGIWIHGYPLDGTPRNPQSKGCVVLTNEELKNLDKTILPKESLIIIHEGNFKKASNEEIATILSSLFEWRNAWKYSKIDKYLNFYSDDFLRYDGTKKRRFSKIKRQIFARKEKKEILFKNINISPYPNLQNRRIFRVSFYEDYRTKHHKI